MAISPVRDSLRSPREPGRRRAELYACAISGGEYRGTRSPLSNDCFAFHYAGSDRPPRSTAAEWQPARYREATAARRIVEPRACVSVTRGGEIGLVLVGGWRLDRADGTCRQPADDA